MRAAVALKAAQKSKLASAPAGPSVGGLATRMCTGFVRLGDGQTMRLGQQVHPRRLADLLRRLAPLLAHPADACVVTHRLRPHAS